MLRSTAAMNDLHSRRRYRKCRFKMDQGGRGADVASAAARRALLNRLAANPLQCSRPSTQQLVRTRRKGWIQQAAKAGRRAMRILAAARCVVGVAGAAVVGSVSLMPRMANRPSPQQSGNRHSSWLPRLHRHRRFRRFLLWRRHPRSRGERSTAPAAVAFRRHRASRSPPTMNNHVPTYVVHC